MNKPVALTAPAEAKVSDRTCNKCGRVAFGVSRKFAEDQVAAFKVYYDKLLPSQQQDYYGGTPANMAQYEHCIACGNPFTNFRPAAAGDCPDGCTISPIIDTTLATQSTGEKP